MNLDIQTEEEEFRQIELLNIVDTELINPDVFLFGSNYREEFGFPILLNLIFWVVIISYLMLFVIPYLAMGGWWKGLFYMFILGLSFFSENVLQKVAPEWFMLSTGSLPSILIIAFFVFANALFFDWLFELGAEKGKVCPSCHTHLDILDNYCSGCGFVQA